MVAAWGDVNKLRSPSRKNHDSIPAVLKKSTFRRASMKKRAKLAPFLICCEVCPAIPWLGYDPCCCSRQHFPVSGVGFAWLALASTQLGYQTQTGNAYQQ